MALLTDSSTMRAALLLGGLSVTACFSPDEVEGSSITDTDTSSADGTDSTDPSNPSDPTVNPSSTDPSDPTVDPTVDPSDTDPSDPTVDPSDTDPSDTDDPTDPTGPEPACGDGTAVPTELCFDDPPISYTTPTHPVDVAVADLSSNGLLDFAVATHNQPSQQFAEIGLDSNGTPHDFGGPPPSVIAVFEADGVGGFVNSENLSAAPRVARVRVYDADDDGDEDIFAYGEALNFYRNQGSFWSQNNPDTGFFGAYSWSVGDMSLADFDDDGIIDVVLSEAYDRTIYFGVLMGNTWDVDGSASLDSPGEGASGMAAGALSFDTDDGIDLVLFNQYYSEAFPLTNNGSGMMTALESVTVCPQDIDGGRYGELADFDDDGNTDILVTCMDGDAAISYGEGDGTFAAPSSLPLAGAFRPYVADIDGDGDDDVLLTSSTLNRAVVYINDGARSFTLSDDVQFMAPGPVYGLAVADMNDDGALDVLIPSAAADNEGRLDVYIATP